MPLTLESAPVPLTAGADGAVRVAGTRVMLDTVVAAFRDGATAEEIVQQYPALPLAKVYAVLGHVLRHEAEVQEYLQGRERRGLEVRAESERRHPPAGLRERLLARRSGQA